MNPAEYLEKCDWNNKDKRFYAKKIGNQWKFTYTDDQRLGQDTVNHITSYLQYNFKVVTCKIRNAARPTLIYGGMPKRKSTLTMILVERPYLETCVWYVEDKDSNIVKADTDLSTAESLAKRIGGTVYYSFDVRFPSSDPKQYWMWNDVQ